MKNGGAILALFAAAGLAVWYFFFRKPAPAASPAGSGGSGGSAGPASFIPTTSRSEGTPAGAPIPSLGTQLAAQGVNALGNVLSGLASSLFGKSSPSSSMGSSSMGSSSMGRSNRSQPSIINMTGTPAQNQGRGGVGTTPYDYNRWTDPDTGISYDMATGQAIDSVMSGQIFDPYSYEGSTLEWSDQNYGELGANDLSSAYADSYDWIGASPGDLGDYASADWGSNDMSYDFGNWDSGFGD